MKKLQIGFFNEEVSTAKKEFKEFVSIQKSIVYFIFKSPSLRRMELKLRIDKYFAI